MKRPHHHTLAAMVRYLESLGLGVYGQNIDLETGAMYPSQRDYGPADVVKLRRLIEREELWETEALRKCL